jgi:hypothetical protein
MNELDISFRSLNLLERSVSKLLQDKILIPDWGDVQDETMLLSYQNVLTTGLFYQKIFEIKNWPKNDFYFYCLSRGVKDILVNLLNFDSEFIGTIPRYQLFPAKMDTIPFPNDFNFKLVHAGRISPQKNIEFIIFVTFYFQLLISDEIELTLMGNFDNDHHRNILGIRDIDYKKKILQLIDSLPWCGKKPIIFADYNQTEWLKKFPKDAIFFSASNLISEDFSVAIAQIQQTLGFPCLIPFWGGFRDVRGDNIKFYDVSNIATSNESLINVSKKAKEFVESFSKKDFLFSPPSTFHMSDFRPQSMINRQYLQDKIIQNEKKWGPEVEHIVNGNFYLFAKSVNGQSFFNAYAKIFSENYLPTQRNI